MALIVADLVAKLGIDAKAMDAQVEAQTKKTVKDLGRIVTAAEEVGRDAGTELGDGLGRGADDGVVSAAKALADGEARMAKVAGDVGGRAGDALAGGFEDEISDDEWAKIVERGIVAAGADGQQMGNRVGKEIGESVTDGVRSGSRGVGAGLGDEFKNNTSDLPAKSRDRGQDVGGALGGGVLDGMPDLSSGLDGLLDDALSSLPAGLAGPATAAGAAIGAALIAGYADAIANDAGADKLAAGLGISTDGAERDRLARASADLYRNAWGESTEDVRTAIDAVYSTLEESRASEAALERLTAKGMAIADVFGTDIGLAVSNAGILIRSKLAKDADEAFDLIAKAATEVPAHLRDELGDATQEYSTFFGQLGFDGREAFGMLVDAAEDGQYAVDKTGDAIKELFLRAGAPNDKTAMDALDALGFKGEEVARRLQGGGEGARDAVSQIAAALLQVEDPAARFALSVDLMGAPVEDLGKRYPEFLEQLRDGRTIMDDTAGAADNLTDSYENTASSIEVVKRELAGLFEDFANKRLDPLAWLVSDDDKSISEWASNVGATIGGGIIDSIKFTVAGPLGWLLPDSPFGGGEGENDGSGPGKGAGAAIAGRQADEAERAAVTWKSFNDQLWGYTDNSLKASTATTTFADEVEKLEDRVKPLKGTLDQSAIGVESFRDALSGTNPLAGLLGTALDTDQALVDLKQTLVDLDSSVNIGKIALGVEDPDEDTAAVLNDVLATVGPLKERIAAAFEFGGEGAMRDTADGIQADLLRIFEQAGLTKDQIKDLFAVMGLTDEDIDIAVKVSGDDVAIAQLQILRDMVGADLNADGEYGRIDAFVGMKVAEGDFTAARDIVLAFQQDMVDGSIDNPILLALNADPTQAKATTEQWSAETAGKVTNTNLGVNTVVADTQFQAWKKHLESQGVKIPVALEVSVRNAQQIIDGGGYGAPYNIGVLELAQGRDLNGNGVIGRAGGGPIPDVGGLPVPGLDPSDTVPTMTTPGEWVIKEPSATKLGPAVMAAVNEGQLPHIPVPVHAGDSGGSSAPASMVEVGRLAAEVRTLAREVARKGNTYQIHGGNAEETSLSIERRQAAHAWSAGL